MASVHFNRKNVIVLITLSVAMVILTAVALKGVVFNWMVERIQKKCAEKYGCRLHIQRQDLEGFRIVHLGGVSLVPDSGDTLLAIQNLSVTLRLRSLFIGRVDLQAISMDTCQISLVRGDSGDNFTKILRRSGNQNPNPEKASDKSRRWDRMVEGIIEEIASWSDKEVVLHRLVLSYRDAQLEEQLVVPELYLEKGRLQASLVTSSGDGVNVWIADGAFSAGGTSFQGSLKKTRGGENALPFLTRIDRLKASFDSIQLGFITSRSGDIMHVETHMAVSGGWINHWRISREEVRVGEMACTLKGTAGPDILALDSGSVFRLGPLNYALQASFVPGENSRLKAGLSFNTDTADCFFRSLPTGMFQSLRGLKTKGGLNFKMELDWPLAAPDSLRFEAGMAKRNFSIQSYGNEDFSRIKAPFSYLAMDGERPVRSVWIGPENPLFFPLDQIPSDLKNAVLICEDPSFMQHRGFVQESIRESMVTNLKQKRFARGGSTISMQLVKNVFLSRNKSVARKLEEILIVWLMEQNGLVSKERMLEVYLNIIEWGPDVYGVGEAARFYFDKEPAELTMPECIFMASLIPSPKSFKYRFDGEGNLKPYVRNFFGLVAGRMVRKEMIPQVVADGLEANVRLVGPAAQIVLPPDTVPVDTLEILPIIDTVD